MRKLSERLESSIATLQASGVGADSKNSLPFVGRSVANASNAARGDGLEPGPIRLIAHGFYVIWLFGYLLDTL